MIQRGQVGRRFLNSGTICKSAQDEIQRNPPLKTYAYEECDIKNQQWYNKISNSFRNDRYVCNRDVM